MSHQHHGMKPFSAIDALCEPGTFRSDRFARMFPDAAPLYIDPLALAAIGAKGGPMQSSGPAKKTQSIPVGFIFFGQFIDHDMTLDLSSSFSRLDQPEATGNARTPTLDLDCVYGDGPDGSPYLYHHGQASGNGIRLLTGADMPGADANAQQDLPRSAHKRAIIGDPRNDENRIISQMQLGFLRFHNHVVDHLAGKGVPEENLFEEARRTVTWHYQWIVVNDFLRAMVGAPLLADILGKGRQVYRPEGCKHNAAYGGDPFIPIEFAAAAYRFGHSMVPQRIMIQTGGASFELFGPSLGLGFSPVTSPKQVVQWPQVLDLTNATTDRADQLDARLAADLLDLPFVPANGVKSLAVRNLLRAQAFRLPSGETVARACGRPTAEIDAVHAAAEALAAAAGQGGALAAGTPLWLYCLIEAAEIGQEVSPGTFLKGEGLGPVGGRIVAETIIGVLELDSRSYLGANRSWTPLDAELKPGGVRRLLDLLTY